ncbi:hypothetical protein KJ972_01630 [Candidatus Micrarchaeota archaeon]|nr:hypothetical protein [Candidatus Micrarchaeota archaeon]
MRGFAEYKVFGGKLLKAEIEYDTTLKRVRFFGDFFLHPEETIILLEKILQGTPIPFSIEAIESKIAGVLKDQNAELVGVSPNDFALVLQEAIQNANSC